MKKILFVLALIVSTLAAPAQSAKISAPLPKPPCKWAGEYYGIFNPTSWPRGDAPIRMTGFLTIGTNYTWTLFQSSFDGSQSATLTNTLPRNSPSYTVRWANGDYMTWNFRPNGVVSGAWKTVYDGERGTYTFYRSNVLP